MSKQQAILETLLGVAQLQGNHLIASRIRQDICQISESRETSGYRRIWCAAVSSRRVHHKAA